MRTAEQVEAITSAASRTTYAGAGVALWSWVTSNGFLGLVGAAVAIGGLLVNWYYRREADARERAAHELQMEEQRLRVALLKQRHRGQYAVDEEGVDV